MVYNPTNPEYENVYSEYANGDSADENYMNARQEQLADNLRYVSNGLYNHLKTSIFNYIKTYGFSELDKLSAAVTLAAANTFNYVNNDEIQIGDFLIVVNSGSEVLYDTILLVTNLAPLPPPTLPGVYTIYETFAGVPGTFSDVYRFRLEGTGESRYFKDFSSSLVDLFAILKTTVIDPGGRLSTLDENNLQVSLGTNLDGTKPNFTNTNYIPAAGSYYTAINQLDGAFYFVSDIKANLLAKIGYTGTDPGIRTSLSDFCSRVNTIAPSNYGLTGLITGNDDTSTYTYPASDNGTINIGVGNDYFTLKGESKAAIAGTITINFTKTMSEVVIDGLTFTTTGRLIINSSSEIDRLVIKNCKSIPTGDRSEYFIMVNVGGNAIHNAVVENNSVTMDESVVSSFEGKAIFFSSTETTKESILTIRNNKLYGTSYFRTKNIVVENNIFKCGAIDSALFVAPIEFYGNISCKNNDFTMTQDYLSSLAATPLVRFNPWSASSTSRIEIEENCFNNTSVRYPNLFEVTTGTALFLQVNNNVFKSEKLDPFTTVTPGIRTQNTSNFTFKNNSIIIKNNLSFLANTAYIKIDNAFASSIIDFSENEIQIYAGTGPSPDYGAVIRLDTPGKLFKMNKNLFIFEQRVANVRFLDIDSPLDGKVFAEENLHQVLAGQDFEYKWGGATVTDDWMYPQSKFIDDGVVILIAESDGTDGDINWGATVTTLVPLDCGGYWDGTTDINIKKEGLYYIMGYGNFNSVVIDTSREMSIVNTGAPIMGVPIFSGVITGTIGINNFGATTLAFPLSCCGQYHFASGDSFKLNLNIIGSSDPIGLTIRRIR